MELDRVVKHSSRIELSQSALKRNINFIQKKIGPDVKLCSVVKANAYGHGIREFVPMVEACGIRHFATASSYEASEVLDVTSPETTIMIMGILYPEDLEWVIGNGIEFYVFDYERLQLALQKAKELDRKAIIHLEVETGGNRTGLPEKDFDRAVHLLKKNGDYLVFKGLCTHLAGAETLANWFRINKQKERFASFLKSLRSKKSGPELRHMASSAAALAMPDTKYDMVRVGVSQYGFWPSPDVYNLHLMEENKQNDQSLKRVLSWKTDVVHLKDVKEGEFVGYSTAFQAPHDMRVAVIPVGYSNGYSRALSNNGHVLIHGKRALICGLVNMNLFMVDVSYIKNVQVGDEVTLIGRQNRHLIGISSFSEFSKHINIDLVSRLPAAIPRLTVK